MSFRLEPRSAAPPPSELPKSGFASKPRLSRTLRRNATAFRPIEDEDIKWAGAGWKKGAFDKMDPLFAQPMEPAEFREVFAAFVRDNYDGAWTILADTPHGRVPIAFLFAFTYRDTIHIGRIVWLPWGAPRSCLEGFLRWLVSARKGHLVLEYSPPESKRFFEHVCRYGVMRRVGTIQHRGELIPFFQSRTPK